MLLKSLLQFKLVSSWLLIASDYDEKSLVLIEHKNLLIHSLHSDSHVTNVALNLTQAVQ